MSLPANADELAERVAALKAARLNEDGRAAIDAWATAVERLWGCADDKEAAALLSAADKALRTAMAADKVEAYAILVELRDRNRRGAAAEKGFEGLANRPRVLRGGKE